MLPPSPACEAPAVSLSPRLQHLRLQLAREQQESSSQPESPVGESQSLHSDSSRVSLPFPLVLGHEGLHCWTRGSGWGLCFSRFSPGMLTSVSDPLLSPRLDHHRGPPLPHNAPLLEPHPARRHQVSLSGWACACLFTGWLTTATPPPPTSTHMHDACQRTPGASLLERGDAIALGTPTPGLSKP